MRAVVFTVVLLVSFVNCENCQEKQIKAQRVQLWYANREYVSELSYEVTKYNQTYNNIGVIWELSKDLPRDLTVYTKVYATDSSGKGGELILDLEIPVCTETENRAFLPLVLIINCETDKCISKGTFKMENMGQLRYEHLIPNIEKKGKYFRADYILGTPTVTILEASSYSEWGYINARVKEDF